MRRRKIIYIFLVFAFILAFIFGAIIFYFQNNSGLKIVFLDVGQGDAILLTEGQNQVLIDGGPNRQKILEELGKYIPFWDRQIEIVIATHPDADHIGGLVGVLGAYQVKTAIKTNAQNDTDVFGAFQKGLEVKKPARNVFGIADAGGAEIIEAKKGVSVKFPSGAELNIVYPFAGVNSEKTSNSDTNAESVVAKLNFGENSFLFTGDLPSEKELEFIKGSEKIKANILKVAHHGSKYATTSEFLDIVKPEDAIISVGKNNKYGHPTQEVLDRLKNIGAKIFRTDEMGDIVYECKVQSSKCKVIFD
jgi:competence protein ComEC